MPAPMGVTCTGGTPTFVFSDEMETATVGLGIFLLPMVNRIFLQQILAETRQPLVPSAPQVELPIFLNLKHLQVHTLIK